MYSNTLNNRTGVLNKQNQGGPGGGFDGPGNRFLAFRGGFHTGKSSGKANKTSVCETLAKNSDVSVRPELQQGHQPSYNRCSTASRLAACGALHARQETEATRARTTRCGVAATS